MSSNCTVNIVIFTYKCIILKYSNINNSKGKVDHLDLLRENCWFPHYYASIRIWNKSWNAVVFCTVAKFD